MTGLNTQVAYDAWLHWRVTERCNLDCIYCFSHSQQDRASAVNPVIDIPALLRSLDAARRTFRVLFTGGGEPFLVPNMVEAALAVSERHYIGFNTNLTSPRVAEFARQVDPSRVYNVNAAIHIKELERTGLLERVIENFFLCRERGIRIAAPVIAYPALVDEAESYRAFFRERGIEIKFTQFLGRYDGRVFPGGYTEREIEAFGLDRKVVALYRKYRGVCDAGCSVAFVFPNGDMVPCLQTKDEPLGNVYTEIHFKRHLKRCPVKACSCSWKQFDPELFDKTAARYRGVGADAAMMADFYSGEIRRKLRGGRGLRLRYKMGTRMSKEEGKSVHGS